MISTGSSSSAEATDRSASPAADLVVCLASYNDAATIAGAVAAAREGLAAFGPLMASRLIWLDAGSTDGTPAYAREALRGTPHVLELASAPSTADLLEVPYHGMPGRARALQALLAAARELRPRACVVLDAGVSSLAPFWIDDLARPVIEHGVDYVSPFYHRHVYDGMLTKGLVYPVFRALYGVRLRQPAATEFACSARLLDALLDEDVWDREGAQAGIDLWIAACAAAREYRVAEAALGVRAAHGRGEQTLDLATTLAQVAGALFADAMRRAERWQRTRDSLPVQQVGRALPAVDLPPGRSLEPEPFIESFRLGYRELRDIWTWVLPPRTILELRKLADAPPSSFRLDDSLWATIVYDFLMGYRLRVIARDHLLRSLVPLYLGWLASFVLQTRQIDEAGVEQRLEDLATAFEKQKWHLIARWRWPERVRA